jgi:hypothetical protein
MGIHRLALEPDPQTFPITTIFVYFLSASKVACNISSSSDKPLRFPRENIVTIQKSEIFEDDVRWIKFRSAQILRTMVARSFSEFSAHCQKVHIEWLACRITTKNGA